jgi:2-polyprenyl-3-methyl-5-hydroxy-6-metoxy-1,4-benzoquinol methylase
MPTTAIMTAEDLSTFHEEPCNLCGGSDYDVVYPSSLRSEPGPDSVKITDGEYNVCGQIVRCNDCGLACVNPRQASETVVSLYSQMEDETYHQEAAGRKTAFRRILTQMMKLVGPLDAPPRLLDVGAATGLLLQEAEQLGWSASGVEPSSWAARVAKEEYGLDVHCGTLEDSPFASEEFDFVTAVDVVEHVADPRGLLEAIRHKIKPAGILCVVTPDFDSFVAKFLKQNWWHVRQAHIYYFTEKSLERLLDEAGYKIMKKKRYGWTFSVDYWASRFENFNRAVFVLSQFLKRRALFRPAFKWNIRINFMDSFEWYLTKK